jgi:hypothetical protein
VLPLGFDADYAATSKAPKTDGLIVLHDTKGNPSSDMEKLAAQVVRFQREVTSKQQELMEMRNKVQR